MTNLDVVANLTSNRYLNFVLLFTILYCVDVQLGFKIDRTQLVYVVLIYLSE